MIIYAKQKTKMDRLEIYSHNRHVYHEHAESDTSKLI